MGAAYWVEEEQQAVCLKLELPGAPICMGFSPIQCTAALHAEKSTQVGAAWCSDLLLMYETVGVAVIQLSESKVVIRLWRLGEP